MKELFDDLILEIHAKTYYNVSYVESDEFCGIELFASFDKFFVGKFGFEGDQLTMYAWRDDIVTRKKRNLCEPGDPIRSIKKFIKKYLLCQRQLQQWICFDMQHPKYKNQKMS
jgi:hypothetical protein